ncbi:hypothetical protein MIND_00252400 [Mycena indigotica]|uniref:Uncharacterized protein n=1 Tax=Mycena indigotica TaxID=2126181 RepID=A0A8H6WDD8_9AGAR|nr:uncharacterized protein MIND_00252400 [Mycena indigotica]KAF7312391.1 hypothetical protein MIND_00252400 [Mycena indigotica]
MPFPFTFNFAVPGLNPFAAESPAENFTHAEPSGHSSQQARARPARPTNVHERRPSPAPPTTRKRGWDPSLAEPSHSSTTLASPSGYLDTPAKYREMASRQSGDDFELEDMNVVDDSDLPPPAKRRRTLAGSIVSTAVSAALIGTAVGLTVYRLWRDRGKEAEPSQVEPAPPPPYNEGAWKLDQQQSHAIHVTPPTPSITPRRRKVRHSVGPSTTTRRPLHRSRPSVNQSTFNPVFTAKSPLSVAATEGEPEASVEDQMDWMGDQLSQLIKEGQRALRSEVVVKSEVQEDEVDDGSGLWEEDDGGVYGTSVSRSASPRQRKRPRNGLALAPPSYSSRPSSASPRTTRFEFGSLPASSPNWRTDEPSSSTSEFGVRSEAGDEGSWESPELRESMRKARERILAMRKAG